MEADARHEHVIDWLEHSSDLPHLIARVSELVHRLGYDPEELVVLPRGELDRRELAAYSSAWADVVDEQLPAIRRAYEERITAAYLQGQEDARTGRRPRRARRPEGEEGGEVIQLPYVQLLRPPSEVTRVEERGERERSVADGGPVPSPGPVAVPGRGSGEGAASSYGRDERSYDEAGRGTADVAAPDVPDEVEPSAGPRGGTGPDILVSASDVREKRSARSEKRRRVVLRNGRPSVPPLSRSGDPANGRDKGRREDAPVRQLPDRSDGALSDRSDRPVQDLPGRQVQASSGRQVPEQTDRRGPRREGRPRLSDRARALADELEGRAGRRRDEREE